jgi:putative ATP-dependent endonuclease of OLD family
MSSTRGPRSVGTLATYKPLLRIRPVSQYDTVRIKQVTIERYRGWEGPTTWFPGQRDVLLGPNNGGKSSLLRAVDVVLNPHRNAYRDLMGRHDFFDLQADEPIEFTVVLTDLSDEDCDVFETYLEGQRPIKKEEAEREDQPASDRGFGPADSPDEEFDQGDLVLRIKFRAELEKPAAAFFARPDAGQQRVSQEHKLQIGWYFVPADLDPLKELAFYSNSIFAKLFEQADLKDELDAIRKGIDESKGDLLEHEHVAKTREQLEEATKDLGLVAGDKALDFEVLDLSDRRVLQSLQLVARGSRSDHRLPLRSHGRGVLRALLLAASLQHVRVRESNLILAVEEPEQNLEPINQRLIARSVLFSPDSSAAQTIVSTHSPAVASVLPLKELELVREFDGKPRIKPLRDVEPAEHKFYERHARGAIIDGLYASAVLLVEGPTELGALPALWTKAFPGNGLDERRVEIVDCESIDKIPSFARFFSALDIPVAALCDCDPDKEGERKDIVAAGIGLLVHWRTHKDIEGVLAGEGDVPALARAMEEVRAEVGTWDEHKQPLTDVVRAAAGDHDDLESATDIPTLIAPFEETDQRAALARILRGKNPSFKSARDQRLLCEALPQAPPTTVKAMETVHRFVEGAVAGEQPL